MVATIVRDFGQNPLQVYVAIGFLYYHSNTMLELLAFDWTSFGRNIGANGAAVNLPNLFNVTANLDVAAAAIRHRAWISNVFFNKLMAGIDMF